MWIISSVRLANMLTSAVHHDWQRAEAMTTVRHRRRGARRHHVGRGDNPRVRRRPHRKPTGARHLMIVPATTTPAGRGIVRAYAGVTPRRGARRTATPKSTMGWERA
jgi:hypothetical protein